MVITYKNYPALKILDGDYSDIFSAEDNLHQRHSIFKRTEWYGLYYKRDNT
jgi:hypothetical protein